MRGAFVPLRPTAMGIVQRDGFKITLISYFGIVLGYINKALLFPKFLKPDEVGLANTLLNLSVVYAQFSALGMTSVTLRFFPFFRDRERAHHGFLTWATLITTAGVIVVSLLFFLLKPWVIAEFSENSPLFVKYYYYFIPLGASFTYFLLFDAYLRSLLKTVVPVLANEVIIRLLTTVSITLYAIDVVDFHQFVILYTISNCVHALMILVYMLYLRQMHLGPKIGYRVQKLKKGMLLFGLIAILSSAGNSLIANLDSLLLVGLMENGLYWAGIYTTLFFMTTVIFVPYRAMMRIATPLVAAHWKDNALDKMEELYKKFTVVNLALGAFIFIGMWANLDNLLSFIPKEFAAGKYVFLFIGIGRLFDAMAGLNGVIVITSNKFRYDLFFTIALIVITILTSYLFIVTLGWGMNGAAIATGVSLLLFNAARLIFVQVHFKMQPFSMACLYVFLIAGAVFGLNYLLPQLSNVFLDMAVRSVLITIAFFAPLILLRIVPDINQFTNKLLAAARIRWRV